MSKPNASLKAYWRSLDAHQGLVHGDSAQASHDEFPGAAEAVGSDGLTPLRVRRRSFVGLLGASTALAGLTTGCIRKPVERILPFAKRPEDVVPGQSLYYSTGLNIGGSVLGILVEATDGRPIKIEGNPKHAGSQGATDVWAQGTVLGIYDPERSQIPKTVEDGEFVDSDWGPAHSHVDAILKGAREAGGKGMALVIPWIVSPSLRAHLAAFKSNYPQARLILCDPMAPVNSTASIEMLAQPGARMTNHLAGASVVVSFDNDFMGPELDHVRLTKEFARGRAPLGQGDPMNRLYVVEPHFSITGANADHHLPLRASRVGPFLIALAHELASKHGISLPSSFEGIIGAQEFAEAEQKWIAAVAVELIAARDNRDSHSAILVGERQPAWVHGLGLVLNVALGNQTKSLHLRVDDTAPVTEGLDALAAGLGSGAITTVFCLDTNPAYVAPGQLGMADLLTKATVVHAGLHFDETARLAVWHLPLNHHLESWGDLESSDGVVTICQPLIEPIFDTKSTVEILAWWAKGDGAPNYDLVYSFWKDQLGPKFSKRRWERWLHDGIVSGIPRSPGIPLFENFETLADAINRGVKKYGPDTAFEVNFHIDPKVGDGRYANNGWLQECPHPMSKLCWDNAAYISPADAKELKVQNCDLLNIQIDDRTVQVPVWIMPGQANKTVSLSLGYGREGLGYVAEDAGINVYPLQAGKNPWFTANAGVSKFGGVRMIYSTQDHGTLDPGLGYPMRPIIRETEVDAEGKWADPKFADKGDLMKPEDLKSLWEHNPEPTLGEPKLMGKQQWGMVIDLNRCNGCNACVVACQAENNIPLVGKKEVGNGREMHWIRLDRYYSGWDDASPEAVFMPMLCQHCETAPCENVCPVAATTHSPEGLNDMAYNRCVGTRYCANNCPYKVRRFNFHNYNKRMDEDWGQDPLGRMVRNPDVTVRFRGVIEKCTYCVQRINGAKIEAHVAGKDTVPDGVIVAACEQVCPSEAIVFGDIADPTTRVAKLKATERDFGVLTDLLTRPRTTYLGRIRNPNPELA